MFKIVQNEREKLKKTLNQYVDSYYSNPEKMNTEIQDRAIVITAKDSDDVVSFIVNRLVGGTHE